MSIYILLFIFVILQLLDVYTTKRNLLDKRGVEYNRYIRYLIDKFGFWRALILSKLFLIIVCVSTIFFILPISKIMTVILLSGINLWYIGVLSFNRFKKVRNLFGFN